MEQRLIDANQLKDKAYKGGDWEHQLVVDWSDIEDAPTVGAVPVVRCRDCKSANVRNDMGTDFYECSQNGVTVFCNGGHFCSYGEPRTPPAE